MSTSAKQVSVERVIAADAQTLFDIVADPAKHPLIDGSGSVKQARPSGPDRLHLGAKFGMDMRIVVPYRISNTVIEFEEGRRIAWKHLGKHAWRYTFEPVADGTRVTETWDWAPMGVAGKIVELAGFPKRNEAGMTATLDRLARLAT
jgi:uncharacterized protein YndB with AHSA1/START domain